MLNVKYKIIHSQINETFTCSFRDVLSQIDNVDGLLKMTVFIGCLSDEDYQFNVDCMNRMLHEKYGEGFPDICYVAQKPLKGSVCAELIYLTEDAQISHENYCGYKYVKVEQNNRKLLYLSGLSVNESGNIRAQGNTIFSKVDAILKKEGMQTESIVRQWNYIPQITAFNKEFQNYQQFNDSRSLFYEKSRWANGYPAATGIGTQYGPLVIDIIAMQGQDDEFAIKNPCQIDAHVYSDQVLLGEKDLYLKQKSTPKFERAKLIVDQDDSVIFVSGTAAIIGEDSLLGTDAIKQSILTLENIERLIEKDNLDGYKMFSATRIDSMRVYIKNEVDFEKVKQVCEERYPSLSFIYLLSDICRDELLVEIEAFVYCI